MRKPGGKGKIRGKKEKGKRKEDIWKRRNRRKMKATEKGEETIQKVEN